MNVVKKASIKYFSKKADQYDLVDKQLYWVLSDKLLWDTFKRYLNKLPKNFNFLDAGGGTGRWTFNILKYYPQAKGLIFDLSPEMLSVAKKNAKSQGFIDRLEFIEGDITVTSALESKKFDIAFNFHNVLGFVENPFAALKNISKSTRKGGYVVSLVPNLYHLIYFNLGLGRIGEAKKSLETMKGRFTPEMPSIYLFTPESISKMYKKLGLNITLLTGFPSTIYPNYQETQIKGQTKNLANLLSSKGNFDQIFDLEQKLIEQKDIASRGNNILIIGIPRK